MLKKAFGIDAHKDVMVVTKLGEDIKETRRFGVDANGLRRCVEWLREDSCLDGAMESTGIYWVPIYASLKDAGFNISVANAYQVRMVPGRKSDQKDSEWLAYLMRAELIKPSYIPDREYQELRTLTRLRARLTQTQTAFKNRAHKILQLCNIRLASKLTDLFGSSGMKILDALVNGVSIDEAIEKCDRRVKKQRDEIKASIIGTLSQTDIFELKICLDNIKLLEEQIKQVDEKIASKVDKDLVDKLCKIPGIAPTSAATIIAEVGEPKRFENEKKVSGWSGLAPSHHQSAGVDKRGRITKQGSVWLRRTLSQCAKAASTSKSSLAQFYSRVMGRRGKSIATIALARRILTIAWRTKITGQEYIEEQFMKKARYRMIRAKEDDYTIDHMAGIRSQASAAIH